MPRFRGSRIALVNSYSPPTVGDSGSTATVTAGATVAGVGGEFVGTIGAAAGTTTVTGVGAGNDSRLLTEDNDFLLLEDGSKTLLEG
jgi:hypothetical protein